MRNNEKEEVMSYYPQTIADQMKKGLSNEWSKIGEIGRVLRDEGLSSVEVNYHMNVDEDFIPDVLSCYKEGKHMMTKTKALEFVADAMRTVLDDDYPHTQDALVDDLMAGGFSEEVAEELVYGPGGIGH